MLAFESTNREILQRGLLAQEPGNRCRKIVDFKVPGNFAPDGQQQIGKE
jgi:hypothetical protein